MRTYNKDMREWYKCILSPIKMAKAAWELRGRQGNWRGQYLTVPMYLPLTVEWKESYYVLPARAEMHKITFKREPLYYNSGQIGWIITTVDGFFIAITGF